MEMKLDRAKRLTLLEWLKDGVIDTDDIPEGWKGGSLFQEYLVASCLKDGE